MQVLRDIHAAGTTILMIEHLVHVIVELAQHVVVLNFGRKLAEGSPEEIVANPAVIETYLGRAPRGGDRRCRTLTCGRSALADHVAGEGPPLLLVHGGRGLAPALGARVRHARAGVRGARAGPARLRTVARCARPGRRPRIRGARRREPVAARARGRRPSRRLFVRRRRRRRCRARVGRARRAAVADRPGWFRPRRGTPARHAQPQRHRRQRCRVPRRHPPQSRRHDVRRPGAPSTTP